MEVVMQARWSPDFLDLLTALNDADAKYMLVGGLRAFGAPLGDVTEADFATGGNGFRMGTPPFRIELLTEISGVAFGDAWPRKESHQLDGVRCYVISRDDLVANKRAAGRPQDVADVDVLERQARKKS
jgi:hypothetical protein